MRSIGYAIVFVVLCSCAYNKKGASLNNMTLSMRLQNEGQPFVSEKLAKEIAVLIVRERYPKNMFAFDGECTVKDLGDIWQVAVHNSTSTTDTFGYNIKAITVKIRKSNAEVVDVS